MENTRILSCWTIHLHCKSLQLQPLYCKRLLFIKWVLDFWYNLGYLCIIVLKYCFEKRSIQLSLSCCYRLIQFYFFQAGIFPPIQLNFIVWFLRLFTWSSSSCLSLRIESNDKILPAYECSGHWDWKDHYYVVWDKTDNTLTYRFCPIQCIIYWKHLRIS